MSDLTIFPVDIAEMSVSQLAALPPEQKREVDKNLDAAIDWLKKARTKFDAALEQCYGEQARAALRESGRDFGTAHINDGPLHIKFELPKKVSWNQKHLGEIAERIVASGEKVEGYLDVKLSVSESRYINWPPALQQQFAAARKRFKAQVAELMRGGNAYFIKNAKGNIVLMAENIKEHDRPLAGFKRRYRKAEGIKRLKRGADIPIAVLVPIVIESRSYRMRDQSDA